MVNIRLILVKRAFFSLVGSGARQATYVYDDNHEDGKLAMEMENTIYAKKQGTRK